MNQNELEVLDRLWGEVLTRSGHWLYINADDRVVLENYLRKTLPLELLTKESQELNLYEVGGPSHEPTGE
jgi:hypothetical protein